jgi:hypothetical protein
MHAIAHPHLPRIALLALGAVVLALVVLLLAAARLGDISPSSGSASSGAAAGAPANVHNAPAASSWVTTPFEAPFRLVLSWNPRNGR